MSRARGEWWPGDVDPMRIATLKSAFLAATNIVYQADDGDYWQSAVATRRRRRGDCEDIQEIFQAEVLAHAPHEAIRLAIVDAGVKALKSYVQHVDDWGSVRVPGIDHATVPWLPDVDAALDPVPYGVRWRASREIGIDPTWKTVVSWNMTGFRCVWSWGLEAGRGVWRKHFARVPAETS